MEQKIRTAATWWNAQLGCRVFDFTGPAKIIFLKGESNEFPLALAVTEQVPGTHTTYRISVSMWTVGQDSPVLHVGVAKHELGHVLGLKHTPKSDLTSIMHPHALSWVPKSRIIPPPYIINFKDTSVVNPKQLRMLRRMYCDR